MAVLINFKICDNSKDCSGIAVCPIKAFYWDRKRRTIAVDNKKCKSCGLCEESCPVGAIRVARTAVDYKRIKSEIARDPRRVSDLFIDRYGSEPKSPAFIIPAEKFKIQILESVQPAVVEFFNHDSIKCLLHSVPVNELFKNVKIKYRKIEVQENDGLLRRYKIKKLPSLIFFKDGGVVGKVEGYYGIGDKKELLEKVNRIISKIKK
ncbi:MAG: thioredoxin domain-containing protein [bacterium]|nr:thioredoxin domain-containing protein [bacterium]